MYNVVPDFGIPGRGYDPARHTPTTPFFSLNGWGIYHPPVAPYLARVLLYELGGVRLEIRPEIRCPAGS